MGLGGWWLSATTTTRWAAPERCPQGQNFSFQRGVSLSFALPGAHRFRTCFHLPKSQFGYPVLTRTQISTLPIGSFGATLKPLEHYACAEKAPSWFVMRCLVPFVGSTCASGLEFAPAPHAVLCCLEPSASFFSGFNACMPQGLFSQWPANDPMLWGLGGREGRGEGAQISPK